jgi:Beta-galactosidase
MTQRTTLARTLLAGGLAAAMPLVAELRAGPAARAISERWSTIPIEPRGQVRLGVSFRPRQAEALGLDVRETLAALLPHPFPVIRLSAYWDRIEPAHGAFDTSELDWQLDQAERAGKEIILCLGPVKSFGYPEYFVPPHLLAEPLPEGRLVDERSHPALLDAATAHLTRLVERYRDRSAIRAWQVEHEATDPLGMEHSWRLAASFIRHEVETVRAADPTRPILMNGFLPTSTAVLAQQWWRTRDQGDSLAVARELADVVGIDFYPRHAVTSLGSWSVYLDGSAGLLPAMHRRRLLQRARAQGRRLVVTEGQAEPWEAVTVPPSPDSRAAASCPPERVVENYNECLRWAGGGIDTYLFWGAEYWVMRKRQGDPRYLEAFARILAQPA